MLDWDSSIDLEINEFLIFDENMLNGDMDYVVEYNVNSMLVFRGLPTIKIAGYVVIMAGKRW